MVTFEDILKNEDKNIRGQEYNGTLISFKDIKEIVKQGKVLPPKSTYIKPKMKSGLIIYNI